MQSLFLLLSRQFLHLCPNFHLLTPCLGHLLIYSSVFLHLISSIDFSSGYVSLILKKNSLLSSVFSSISIFNLLFNHFALSSVSIFDYSGLFQGRVLGPILLVRPSLLSPLGSPTFVGHPLASVYLQAKSIFWNTHLVALVYLRINLSLKSWPLPSSLVLLLECLPNQ